MYEMLLALRKNPMVKTCFAFGDALHVTMKGERENGEKENGETNLTLLHSYALTVSSNVTVKIIEPNIEDCYMILSQNVAH
jgi:hypothetical protein